MFILVFSYNRILKKTATLVNVSVALVLRVEEFMLIYLISVMLHATYLFTVYLIPLYLAPQAE